MLADKNTVQRLIPQEKPMIMVDELLEHDEDRTVTGFSVETDNLFAVIGRVGITCVGRCACQKCPHVARAG